MFDLLSPGSPVELILRDGSHFVGSFDSVDDSDVYVSGVRIPVSIVRELVHPDGPCDDYRCCIG